MFRYLFASFLVFGRLATAQPTCSACDAVTDSLGTINTCYCDSHLQVEFVNEFGTTFCDDQIAVFRCDGLDNEYPITFLPACKNNQPGVCNPGNNPPPCDPVGFVQFLEEPPNLGVNFEWPIPECECIRVVYTHGESGSSSPPPYNITMKGVLFEIANEECPVPTPAPQEITEECDEESENPCFRACGDVPGYDDKYGDLLPCKKPTSLIFQVKENGNTACNPGKDCCGDNPIFNQAVRVCQDEGKCTCSGDPGEAPYSVVWSDKGEEFVGEVTELKTGDCFGIGFDSKKGAEGAFKLESCPTVSVSGPGRQLYEAPPVEGDVTPFIRSRHLKSKSAGRGGGGGGGFGECFSYKFESETNLQVMGAAQDIQDLLIHTSCSQPLVAGMCFGSLELHSVIYEEQV